MIPLESKMIKAEQAMNNPEMIKSAIAPFADLISKTEEETKQLLASSETYMSMFQKFFTASVVAMISDKAAEFEASQA